LQAGFVAGLLRDLKNQLWDGPRWLKQWQEAIAVQELDWFGRGAVLQLAIAPLHPMTSPTYRPPARPNGRAIYARTPWHSPHERLEIAALPTDVMVVCIC